MKLELKHISPYLPYELNGYISFLPDTTFILDGMVKDFVKCYTKEGNNTPVSCIIKKFKPILRPLSNLNTKFCEAHNIEFTHRLWSDLNFNQGSTKEGCSDYFTFKDVQLLAKFHFDLFGLIDAGLAVKIE